MSAPRRGREDRLPAGSRAAKTRGRALAGGKEHGEARESQLPGAARAAPAELGAEGGGASPRILRLGLLRRRGHRGPSRNPRPAEQRSARRGARIPSEDPRVHHGFLCVAKLKLSLREPLAPAAECCFCERFREAGSRGT